MDKIHKGASFKGLQVMAQKFYPGSVYLLKLPFESATQSRSGLREKKVSRSMFSLEGSSAAMPKLQ
jgi:hypothetical protein